MFLKSFVYIFMQGLEKEFKKVEKLLDKQKIERYNNGAFTCEYHIERR